MLLLDKVQNGQKLTFMINEALQVLLQRWFSHKGRFQWSVCSSKNENFRKHNEKRTYIVPGCRASHITFAVIIVKPVSSNTIIQAWRDASNNPRKRSMSMPQLLSSPWYPSNTALHCTLSSPVNSRIEGQSLEAMRSEEKQRRQRGRQWGWQQGGQCATERW